MSMMLWLTSDVEEDWMLEDFKATRWLTRALVSHVMIRRKSKSPDMAASKLTTSIRWEQWAVGREDSQFVKS